ncbi:Z-ring formation inhibitor MciZ [Ectobacillus sp. JY-23]|uniref:Z-ring formation inhibitor MciZ n=1 Tax=Ectobacillus sp. JY-23 TaxID=2933872 RepID=UPI0034A099FE
MDIYSYKRRVVLIGTAIEICSFLRKYQGEHTLMTEWLDNTLYTHHQHSHSSKEDLECKNDSSVHQNYGLVKSD